MCFLASAEHQIVVSNELLDTHIQEIEKLSASLQIVSVLLYLRHRLFSSEVTVDAFKVAFLPQ